MPSESEPSWRVLIALLVYNGEEFVGPCLSSLARLDPASIRLTSWCSTTRAPLPAGANAAAR